MLAASTLARALADPPRLPQLRLRLQPALRLLRSRHAIVALWAAHQRDDVALALGEVDPAQPQNALVLRRDDEVLVVALAGAAAAFVAALRDRLPLGPAAAAGLAIDPAFDVAHALALLLRLQALAGVAAARASPATARRGASR